jgi:hypothetical protein
MLKMLFEYYHEKTKISSRKKFSQLNKEDQQKLFLYQQYLNHFKNIKINVFYVFYSINSLENCNFNFFIFCFQFDQFRA